MLSIKVAGYGSIGINDLAVIILTSLDVNLLRKAVKLGISFVPLSLDTNHAKKSFFTSVKIEFLCM